MPSTRKQKAREKRSRQSDVMSDIENLDVMLGSYQRENNEFRSENNENTLDQRSNEREGQDRNVEDYQTFLNNNPSENSCLTIETSRAISSEISSQMSRKFQEMQTSLNSQILDVINSAIGTGCFPASKMLLRDRIQRKIQTWTFGQTDCMKILQPQKILRRTFGQIDCNRIKGLMNGKARIELWKTIKPS